jgi:hypothetical protein
MSEDPHSEAAWLAAMRALIESTRGALRFQADHGGAPAGRPRRGFKWLNFRAPFALRLHHTLWDAH